MFTPSAAGLQRGRGWVLAGYAKHFSGKLSLATDATTKAALN